MLGPIARYRSVIILVSLAVLGLALIGVSQTFQWLWGKIQVDHLVAEVGALLLVVGILHWLFELRLREEMLREVAAKVVGSTLLHDSGLESCKMNSREVDESYHWSRSASLTLGYQYSPRFFKDFNSVLRERCKRGLPTTAMVLRENSAAARYVEEATAGKLAVAERVTEICALVGEIVEGAGNCRLVFHDRVLRYSFIQTDEYIWVNFFTNSPGRAEVPAFKVRAGTPLFEFFATDIRRLMEHCLETN